MPTTDIQVTDLKINVLTEEQYSQIQSPSNTELYLVPEVVDTVPTENSTNTITSGAVYNAIQGVLPSSTKYGASLELTINSSTFVVTAQLKDQDGNNLGAAQTIDLPLESVVVSGSYDDTTKKVVLTLQNGNTVEFSVADLVNGLQSEITAQNPLSADLVVDGTSNKVFTAAEQDKLSGIESGAEVNVQSDWSQTDNTADDFIKNQPTALKYSAIIPALEDGAVIENVVQDYDGNWYNGVVMNNQIWLKENLKTTHYSDGSVVVSYMYPNNDVSNKEIYGLLYDWDTMMNGEISSISTPSGVKGISPDGFHIPSSTEWDSLFSYIGTKSNYILDNNSQYIAKSLSSTFGWYETVANFAPGNQQENNNATNFTIVPAGNTYNGGTPGALGVVGHCLSCTNDLYDQTFCEIAHINYAEPAAVIISGKKSDFRSVRCVMDMSASDWFAANKERLYLKNTSNGFVWSQLSEVAESGSYNDLLDKPVITSEILICNYSNNAMDKTIAEIYEAFSSGKMVFCKESNHIYTLEVSTSTTCRFKANTNTVGSMSFDWITGVNSNDTDTWTFGSNPYVPQEVLWCTYNSTNNTVSGLTIEQIIDAKTNNKVVCCKDDNNVYMCTFASNQRIVFTSVNSNVSASPSETFLSYQRIDNLAYSATSQAWGKDYKYIQPLLVGSGTGQNIKTINNESILGSGNITTPSGVASCTYNGHMNSSGTITGLTLQEMYDAKIAGKEVLCMHGDSVYRLRTINSAFTYVIFDGVYQSHAAQIIYNPADTLWYMIEGIDVNVQSDWNQTNSSASDYIKNKPISIVKIIENNGTFSCDKTPKDFYDMYKDGATPLFYITDSDIDADRFSFIGLASAEGDSFFWAGEGSVGEEVEMDFQLYYHATTTNTYYILEISYSGEPSEEGQISFNKITQEYGSQSDWIQNNNSSVAYIRNMPEVFRNPIPVPSSLEDGAIIEKIVQDYDGNWYNGVVMNNRIWLKENLRTTRWYDGETMMYPDVTNYPNGDASNVETYGYLYSGNLVNIFVEYNFYPIEGTHVPSKTEFDEMFAYIGTKSEYILNNNPSYIAKALSSTTGWNLSTSDYTPGKNPESNNATNMTFVPAGMYYISNDGFGSICFLWSSTEDSNSSFYTPIIASGSPSVITTLYSPYSEFYLPIRLVMDISASDWFDANRSRLYLKNTSNGFVWSQLSGVAESGSYNDLSDKPPYPVTIRRWTNGQ